ncbi:MAG TPA: cell division protein FtsQ/DivIB [Gammaproteobacteria bacterium]|nr:cell division protein FtsQ/DivIB [Gammaproteobacteria bacterium]
MNRRRLVSSHLQHLAQLIKVMMLGAITLWAVFLLNDFKLSRFFPINIVRVYGVHHLDRQELQDLLLPFAEQGFFAMNVDNIRDRLSQLPWVSSSFVRRYWPNQLQIIINEQQVLAIWNDRHLLSLTGELFSPDRETYPHALPRLIAQEGKQMVMIRYFHAINRLLQPLHVTISVLELTPDDVWKLVLSNGIILQMGQKDILTRLNRFVKVYPKIIGNRTIDVEYIDLRYSNGVAVKWKK